MAQLRRAIIFDFDGTIVDTVVAFARVFEDLTHQPKPLTPAQIKQLKGLSVTDFMQTFQLPKWKIPYFLFQGRRRLRQHMDGTKLYAGIERVLVALHAQGIPLYIVSSNSTETIQTYLRQHNLAHYFTAISGGASPFAKARKLLRLLDNQGLDVATSWYVGDEIRDVSAAHAVGINIASVTWGFNSRELLAAKQPSALVDTPAELLQVLQTAWKQST